MPASVENLVETLLADKDFYPDLPPDERKSRAYAIANKQLNASVDLDANIFIAADEPSFNLVRGADGATMLVFKNAVLASAEVNRNRDEITAQGIQELAESIAGRPIDVEHIRQRICGVFSGGRAVAERCLVDGAIFADHYPQEAQSILDGGMHLSIKAKADKAACSVCGSEFGAASQYCAHLQDRRTHNAVRKLSGLKALGGAITKSPAGSRTAFDPQQLFVVAKHEEGGDYSTSGSQTAQASWYDSYLKEGETINDLPASDFADPDGKRFPYKIHGKVIERGWLAAWSAANGGHTGTKDESAIARLRRDKPQGIDIEETMDENALQKLKDDLAAALSRATQLEAEKGDLQTRLAAKEGEVKSLTEGLQAADARNLTLLASLRRQRLAAIISDDEWAKQKNVLMAMADDAFELVAGMAERTAQAGKLTAFTVPQETSQRLTLR